MTRIYISNSKVSQAEIHGNIGMKFSYNFLYISFYIYEEVIMTERQNGGVICSYIVNGMAIDLQLS